jgi:hypothetical protein
MPVKLMSLSSMIVIPSSWSRYKQVSVPLGGSFLAPEGKVVKLFTFDIFYSITEGVLLTL